MCPFLLISCCDLLWCAGGEVWRLDYMRQKGRRYSNISGAGISTHKNKTTVIIFKLRPLLM